MLQSLKLTGLAAALAEQRGLPDIVSLTFEERLELAGAAKVEDTADSCRGEGLGLRLE